MTRDEMIRLAREVCVQAPQEDLETTVWAFDDAGLERFAVLIAEAEREACCSIVYGQCGSDNVAQRTVDAIKARGRWVKTYSGGVPNYTTEAK